MKPIMEAIDEKIIAKGAGFFPTHSVCAFVHLIHSERQGDCYKCIQFALCACAGLSFFVERFSACLSQLCTSEGNEENSKNEFQSAAALGKAAHLPAPADASSKLASSTVQSRTSNVCGPATAPVQGLPPALLARIEASKQAALQRRKAAEAASAVQVQSESGSFAAAAAAPHDAVRPPAVEVLPPFAAAPDAKEVWRSAKRHWGELGAVSDDGND